MKPNFSIKSKSTLPWLEVQITKDGRLDSSKPTQCCDGDSNSSLLDLTGCSVKFVMEACGREPRPVKITGETEITDEKQGIVTHKWNVNDTYFPGLYSGYFEITFADASILVWPYTQELRIEIT